MGVLRIRRVLAMATVVGLIAVLSVTLGASVGEAGDLCDRSSRSNGCCIDPETFVGSSAERVVDCCATPVYGAAAERYPAKGCEPPFPPPPPPPPPLCQGLVVTVNLALSQSPTPGDDVILGTPAADVIGAMAGDDLICALGGEDYVTGGPGNDVMIGSGGPDAMMGNGGNDTLLGLTGNDSLGGGTGDDALNGGENADTCAGNSGTDTAVDCQTVTGVP